MLDEVAAKLATLGVGTLGTSLFIGMMPETPNACASVYETGGLAPDFRFGSAGIDLETAGIQVVCRGEAGDYVTPRANSKTAYEGLAAVECATLSVSGGTSAFYHWIHPQQAPFQSKRDANGRVYVTFNALIEKELSST